MTRQEKILAFLSDESSPLLTFDELATTLAVPADDREQLSAILDALESEGQIIKTKKGRYGSAARLGFVRGIFRGHERGFGFLLPLEEADGDDIFIPADCTCGAMDGDTVLAHLSGKGGGGRRGDKKREGEITRILVHAHDTVVGQFETGKKFGFVMPDDKRLTDDIFISKSDFHGAKDGQKVVVKLTKFPQGRRNAEGKIVEILGNPGDPGVDILCVMKQHGLDTRFPARVEKALGSIPDAVTPDALYGREDFRKKTTITIDGADAKDLDDAIHIEKREGGWTLGVHIADVSHYVKEGGALDKEALRRGTSVYLVDRVVPMLPPKLSNGICSLNPHVDRLTLSCVMDIDMKGNVIAHRITPGVICTAERMTYTNVSAILDGDAALKKRYQPIVRDLRTMAALAKLLKSKRMKAGSIDFDFPEAKITLDDQGRPVDIQKYRITAANCIIEEFMLLANQTVAAEFTARKAPFVYRVHESPTPDKITAFNEYVRNLGYHIKNETDPQPKEFSRLLEKIKGTREEVLIGKVMLRSLMKARYFEEDLGHFGLAFTNYCHFTSPIRRYPDLCIHRIIKEMLASPLPAKRDAKLRAFVKKAASLSSEAELTAQEAEREVDDLKKAEYMAQHVGEDFDGVISSVASFGFFVELENTCEGLVRLNDLNDDYYIYDEKNLLLTGERTKRQFRIGDTVRVTVARASAAQRQVDFVLKED